MKRLLLACCLPLAVALATRANADETANAAPPFAEPADSTAAFQVETVIDGLAQPTGLAFRPRGEGAIPEAYLAESGAGRIVAVRIEASPHAVPVVAGFPQRKCAALGDAEAGPLGVCFLTDSRLAVGEAGAGPGADRVRVYALPDAFNQQTAASAPVKYAAVDHATGPVAAEGDSPATGALLALAVLDDKALFVAPLESGDSKSPARMLLRAPLAANKLAALERFVDAAQAAGVDAPTALAINVSPDSPYIVVGCAGAADEKADSAIAFLSPRTGARALALPCGLRDVVALVYAPSGQLYAADASWADPGAAGIYRLDAAMVSGRQACRPVKIATLARPMGLAFAMDGALYATDWGDSPAGGRLVRITGIL